MSAEDRTAALSEAIARDIATGAPYRPHAAGLADVGAAYAVQDAVVERLRAAGDRVGIAGYKIALNAPALMARFGAREPASGRVLASACHASPARLSAGAFRTFAFEPEIAAVLARPLPHTDAPFAEAAVAAAIERLVPALELIDLRGAAIETLQLGDIIAQNITNAGAVLGGDGAAPDGVDASAVLTEVLVDGRTVHAVRGGAPQPPLEAATWLANHLAARGLSLEAGQMILCGTHMALRPFAGPASIEVRMSGLGTVSLRLD